MASEAFLAPIYILSPVLPQDCCQPEKHDYVSLVQVHQLRRL